jgi:hypothetical protein
MHGAPMGAELHPPEAIGEYMSKAIDFFMEQLLAQPPGVHRMFISEPLMFDLRTDIANARPTNNIARSILQAINNGTIMRMRFEAPGWQTHFESTVQQTEDDTQDVSFD